VDVRDQLEREMEGAVRLMDPREGPSA
jgi:hypothetical protein